MADRESISGQKADLWQLKIGAGGDTAPLSVTLDVGMIYDVVKKTSTKTGTTPLGALVQGSMIEGKITFNQTDYVTFKELLSMAANAPSNMKVAGDELTGIQLTFHDPAAGETVTGDIIVLDARFTSFKRVSDGQGLSEWECEFFGCAVAGVVGRIGAAA